MEKLNFKGRSLSETFEFYQNWFINELKNNLPSNVLEQVKEISVLDLCYASENVYKIIKEIGQKYYNFFLESYNSYSKIQEEQFKNDSIEFIKKHILIAIY